MRTVITAFLIFVLSAGSAHALFGRTQPVLNLTNVPVMTGSGKAASVDQVKQAIFEGASYKRWQVRDEGPGHMVAQIYVRTHMAEVDIKYDAKTYTITYKNSSNLLYDGAEIHRNYNKWIQFMSDEINARLRQY